jgi:hypothetical protein
MEPWVAVVIVVAVIVLLFLIGGSGYCMVAPTSGLRGLQAAKAHLSSAGAPSGTKKDKLAKAKAALPKMKAGKRDLRGSGMNRERDVPKANF